MFARAVLVSWGVFSLCDGAHVFAQTINSWTNLTSGAWEDMRWSLDQLPGQGQMVLIDNPGWKAVAIGSATVQNFPQTLQPVSITISSPTNSYNELLLNYAGFQTPLSVDQLRIDSNAGLTALSSALQVNSSVFSIGGTLNQGDYSTVSGVRLQVGDIGPGVYNFTNGTVLVSDTLALGGNFPAQFNQFDGTNFTAFLSLGNDYPPLTGFSAPGFYALSGGVLVTSSTALGPWGQLQQSGGTHTTDSLALNGDQTGPTWADYGEYSLTNGMLTTRNTFLGLGYFVQSGGTNQVAGDLTVTWRSWFNSEFILIGGLLQTSNTMVTNIIYTGGGFTQSGGTQIVSNLLAVSRANPAQSVYVYSGDVDFLLSGGQLIAQNIQVDSAATFHHRGGTLINSGMLTLANGNWEANTNNQNLGKLLLGVSQANNSSIIFPNGPSSLYFGNSSSVNWSNQAVLTIEHWSGSLAGGGLHQLFFGGDGSGLTAKQLAQIQFHDPAGIPGTYPATMLSTGEVVPTQVLVSKRTGSSIALSWTAGMILQTSTHAVGPFQDITAPAATSYTVLLTEPQRFFRLRSASKAQPALARN